MASTRQIIEMVRSTPEGRAFLEERGYQLGEEESGMFSTRTMNFVSKYFAECRRSGIDLPANNNIEYRGSYSYEDLSEEDADLIDSVRENGARGRAIEKAKGKHKPKKKSSSRSLEQAKADLAAREARMASVIAKAEQIIQSQEQRSPDGFSLRDVTAQMTDRSQPADGYRMEREPTEQELKVWRQKIAARDRDIAAGSVSPNVDMDAPRGPSVNVFMQEPDTTPTEPNPALVNGLTPGVPGHNGGIVTVKRG
jgi:hypothetical protein